MKRNIPWVFSRFSLKHPTDHYSYANDDGNHFLCQNYSFLHDPCVNRNITVLQGGLLSVPFALICIAVLLNKLGVFREAIEPLFHSSKAGFRWGNGRDCSGKIEAGN